MYSGLFKKMSLEIESLWLYEGLDLQVFNGMTTIYGVT